MEKDVQYMQRAIELAGWGLGSVSPNPLVGCVVVAKDKIIGEGWHKNFGGPHAEVNAIASVTELSLLSGSTVYVNLEPCAHFGKTPPCADLLAEKKVKRVVIANGDPNPQVAGKGIEKLRAAGIDVTVGVLSKEGQQLNRRFFARMEQELPYVILKWAESSDGFFGPSVPGKTWISNALSRQRVHQWRAEEDAVLVGTRTALTDNPQLTVRDWTGRNPVRLVIDRNLRLPATLHVFDQSQPTVCFNLLRSEKRPNVELVKLEAGTFLESLLAHLRERNIGSVMVEGGAMTLDAFLKSGLWHELRVFTSKEVLGEGLAAPLTSGQVVEEDHSTGDRLKVWVNPDRIRNEK